MRLADDFFNIVSCNGNESELTCNIALNSSHFIYTAHFPGNPITPGVCIVQIAQEILEKQFDCKLALTTLNNIKFMQVLSPLNVGDIQYKIAIATTEEKNIKIKATVSDSNNTYSKFTATYKQL